jgi:hypothetical protein
MIYRGVPSEFKETALRLNIGDEVAVDYMGITGPRTLAGFVSEKDGRRD